MAELDEQLRLLVQQYGIAEVRRRLRGLTKPPARPRVRRSARDYVTGMKLPIGQTEKLLALAQLFEEKLFLPTAAIIRNFLEAYGAAPVKFKTRQDAIPLMFRFLSSLSDERLDRIIKDGAFAGPSELGPIADAIMAKSATLRHGEDAARSPGPEESDLDPLHQPGKADACR